MKTERQRQAIVNSPCCSFWLSKAYSDLSARDIVDAIRDAELLKAMLDARYDEMRVAEQVQEGVFDSRACSYVGRVTRADKF